MSTDVLASGDDHGLATPRLAGKTGYGIDEPHTITELAVAGALAIATGFVLSDYAAKLNPTVAGAAILVGPSVGFILLVVTAALYWSSRLGKAREMGKIVDDIPWGGAEVVLDLGCGRGLASVMAARRLEGGYAVGIDMWSKARVSGNDFHSVLANAGHEGVDEKLSPVKGASAQLPLADSSVDIILSGMAIHHIVPKKQREALFEEMARVLKEGGRIGILDAGNGGQYSQLLHKTGLRDIHMHRLRFSSFPPFHVVLARKPYAG